MADYKNREDNPCGADEEHKFPPEFYELAADDSSADDWCCVHCGWSRGDLQALEHQDMLGLHDPSDAMDGDHQSALASAGFGTDEDYGLFDCGGEG